MLLLCQEESRRSSEAAAWLRRGLELGAKILYAVLLAAQTRVDRLVRILVVDRDQGFLTEALG